jgi:3-oxoacyl-[acyl-carrier-protein] synthase-1/3-oxoacyl-[acyl-carrier-protein] synthase II
MQAFIESSPSGLVNRELRLRGPHQQVTTACSSGSVAIAQAAAWVRGGVCDAAIAGGAERLTRLCYAGFASLMIADSQPCRPFDRTRAGLNLGEGAGFILIERASSAHARKARILGWLLGDGNSCDAFNLAQPNPQGDGLRRAIAESLRLSGIAADDLGFINAHGTGTLDNDRVEARAFGSMLPGVPFFSTKALTGHTLGAAGGIEAVLTLICLEAGQVPASAGYSEPCPDCGCSPTSTPQPIRKPYAMSTSVGYGGSNVALVFAASGTGVA